MRTFERAYLCAEPFLPPIYGQVRRALRATVDRYTGTPARILDVGGRKSHYTIGVPAIVTITDLPRTTELQAALNLGLTDAAMTTIRRRRSNVQSIVLDDMTCSGLPSESFDVVVAVEVLEHVEADDAFVGEVARVLRAGGTFLMTTPNGDAVPQPHNSDHRRHYPAAGLRCLLQTQFERVDVRYAVVNSAFRRAGLRPWRLRRPIQTACSMIGNLVAGMESAAPSVRERMMQTRHLIAIARKAA